MKTILVCERISNPLVFKDNRLGKCMACGWRIQFRPHVPKGPRMCRQCAFDRMTKDDKIIFTRKTLEELEDYYRKKQQ